MIVIIIVIISLSFGAGADPVVTFVPTWCRLEQPVKGKTLSRSNNVVWVIVQV